MEGPTINNSSATTANQLSDTSKYGEELFANMNRNQINIAIVGAVSAGKSTLLNTIFANTYSHCKIKRTTMTPQIYYEYDGKSLTKTSKAIREQNKNINETLIRKTEAQEDISLEDIKEAKYIVPKIYNFTSLVKDVYLSVYDIPGLNDARTKSLYFEYLETNFYKFDIILFVVDINSALNTSDEIEILTKIISNCKTNSEQYDIHNKLIILANKCDEMSLDDNNELQLEEEHFEMFEQITNQVNQTVSKVFPSLDYKILPLSSEDSYIYRVLEQNPETELDLKYLNKFGYMEFGRTRWNRQSESQKKQQIKKLMKNWDMESTLNITGFNGFKSTLNEYLAAKNQKTFINNHIVYELKKITQNGKVDITEEVQKFYKYYLKYKIINKRIQSGLNCMDIFADHISEFMLGYKTKVLDGFIDGTSRSYSKTTSRSYSQTLINNITNDEQLQVGNKSKKNNFKTKPNTKRQAKEWGFYINCSIKNESFIPQIEESKKILDNMTRLFNGDFKIITELTGLVNEALTKFYRDQIDLKTKPINTLFEYIKSLLGFNVSVSKTNIDNFFENADILNKNPQEIIEYVNKFEEEGLLDETTKMSKILDIMAKIYCDIGTKWNNPSPIIANGSTFHTRTPSYVYYCDQFWQKFIMFNDEYDSKIDELGFYCKRNLPICVVNNHQGMPTTFSPNKKEFLLLENYYLQLYTEHVNSFMKHEHNEKVNLSIENSGDEYIDDIGADIDRELGLIHN